MRILEGIMILLALLSLGAWIMPRWPLLLKALLTLAALISCVLQFVIEGYRFPILPAYILVAGVSVYAVVSGLGRQRGAPIERPKRQMQRRRLTRVSLAAVLSLAVVLVVALPVLLPVFQLEQPTGTFAVGTTTRMWSYQVAADPTTGAPAEDLSMYVQFWYPAERTGARTVPYATSQTLARAAADSGVPAWLVDSVKLVHTDAVLDAPVAQARSAYPVIMFLPGEGVPALAYTALMQELASHGFIMASISVLDPALETRILHSQSFSDQAVAAVWLPRISFTLGHLDTLDLNTDEGGVLAGRMDLRHVGILGHSYGGAAVPLALVAEPRLTAGLDMDGIFYGGSNITDGVHRPFLYMDTTQSHQGYTAQEIGAGPANYALYQRVLTRRANMLRHGGYEVTLQGAWHLSFSDFGLYSPVLALVSPLSQQQAHHIVSAYSEAFFEQNLAGSPSSLLQPVAHPFPQAALQQMP